MTFTEAQIKAIFVEVLANVLSSTKGTFSNFVYAFAQAYLLAGDRENSDALNSAAVHVIERYHLAEHYTAARLREQTSPTL